MSLFSDESSPSSTGKAQSFANLTRLAMLLFATFSGIVGTIIMFNVKDLVTRVTATQEAITALTERTKGAEGLALQAQTAAGVLKELDKEKFDTVEAEQAQHRTLLQRHDLTIQLQGSRITCLENKTRCPQPQTAN
jgi:hypothetical protein